MFKLVKSFTCRMKNVGLLSYTGIPNVDMSFYSITNTFANITTDFIRKVFKYWEAVKLMVADTNFPKL